MKANTSRIWGECLTPVGRLALTASDNGLDGLHFPGRGPERSEATRRDDLFERTVAQLHEYFAGARTQFELELDLSSGTPFQQSVWRELRSIPHGETITYGQLAARLGRADRVRAVGAAVGRTPVPVIIPCHRVIGSDGKLTGYVGGLQRKRSLLDLESAVRFGHPVPTTFATRQLVLL
jgi:methylated-DNA-[protein]-cysteine S-methyltransferase